MERRLNIYLGFAALLALGTSAYAQGTPATPKARGAAAPASSQEPSGTWLTEGGESQVRFVKCGPSGPVPPLPPLAAAGAPPPATPARATAPSGAAAQNLLPCAAIVWVKEDAKDQNNPDPNLRSRSIVGMPLITDIKPDPEGGWTAALYNPENGKTYTGKLKLENANSMRVSGCVLGGLICGGQTWSKVVDTARPGGT